MMPVTLCLPFPFFAPCDDMLTMFVYATHWPSMHLYTLAHMSMHESCLLVCRPYFNTMKLWTSDPNLHLSLMAPPSVCLLAFLFVHLSLLVMSPTTCYACHIYLACLLLHLFAHYLSISFFPLLVYRLSCSFLCIYTHGTRMHRARAWSPKHKQKGQRRKHVDIGQMAMFSSFTDLASPIWLCTLLYPLPSSLLSLLDGLY